MTDPNCFILLKLTDVSVKAEDHKVALLQFGTVEYAGGDPSVVRRNLRSPVVVTAPESLTTSSELLFHCGGSPVKWGILGDAVHDTIPEPGLRLHSLGLEEISGDRRWRSLGNAVLETGVAQICHEGFSITVADGDRLHRVGRAASDLRCLGSNAKIIKVFNIMQWFKRSKG